MSVYDPQGNQTIWFKGLPVPGLKQGSTVRRLPGQMTFWADALPGVIFIPITVPNGRTRMFGVM